MRIVLVFFSVFFSLPSIFCQNFHLVKDINSATDGNPTNYSVDGDVFAVLDSVSYFTTDAKPGLWRSDGNLEGTYLVRDDIMPISIVTTGSKLFFITSDSIGLWMSDGTADGTRPVLKNIPSGYTSFSPSAVVPVGNEVFFMLQGTGAELWKSDGTVGGTVRVKDFYNPDPAINPYFLSLSKAIGNKLYFTTVIFVGEEFKQQRTLWASDGTEAGTYVVSNEALNPLQIIGGGGDTVFFTAHNNLSANRRLWMTDGKQGHARPTPDSIGLVLDPDVELVRADSFLYFVASVDSVNKNNSLYKCKTTGSDEPLLVKGVGKTSYNGTYSYIYNIASLHGRLLFSLYDAAYNKFGLWATGGSTQGSIQIKEDFMASGFCAADSIFYFPAIKGTNGGLWKTDGTAEGTLLVKNI